MLCNVFFKRFEKVMDIDTNADAENNRFGMSVDGGCSVLAK